MMTTITLGTYRSYWWKVCMPKVVTTQVMTATMMIPGSLLETGRAMDGAPLHITDNDGHATIRRNCGQYLAGDNAINQSVTQEDDDVEQDDQFAWPPSHCVTSEYLPLSKESMKRILV